MATQTQRRISVELGSALEHALEEAANKLGLSKAETIRRATSYLREALNDEEQGYCVGSWKELENGIEKKRYLIR
mgnify:CR=1 FL=1